MYLLCCIIVHIRITRYHSFSKNIFNKYITNENEYNNIVKMIVLVVR